VLRLGAALDRQHVRREWAGTLFDQRIDPFGQAPAIQHAGNFHGPILMEMVKQPRWDSRPVMDRHDTSLCV
jgi:hypothetical protein